MCIINVEEPARIFQKKCAYRTGNGHGGKDHQQDQPVAQIKPHIDIIPFVIDEDVGGDIVRLDQTAKTVIQKTIVEGIGNPLDDGRQWVGADGNQQGL